MPWKTKYPVSENGTKICSRCLIEKPILDFHCYHGHLKPNCKKCTQEATLNYYHRNKEARKAYQHKINHTPERMKYMREYRANYLKKRNQEAPRPKPTRCEVCGRDGQINYDHIHTFRRNAAKAKASDFRGWLCSACNAILGYALDDSHLLRKLADYLDHHRAVSGYL